MEINTLNEQPFKGTITINEAVKTSSLMLFDLNKYILGGSTLFTAWEGKLPSNSSINLRLIN
jgi:hypothetical protein